MHDDPKGERSGDAAIDPAGAQQTDLLSWSSPRPAAGAPSVDKPAHAPPHTMPGTVQTPAQPQDPPPPGGAPTGSPGAAAVTVRGSLDMTDVPLELRYRRPEARHLHARLEQSLGIVDLILTDNRRRMLSSKRRKNRIEIRLHHMFIGCTDDMVHAVALLMGAHNAARMEARAQIQAFIRDNRAAISFEPTGDELEARGAHYNLAALLGEVIDGLDPALRARVEALDELHITWGRRSSGTRSIRFGSYDFDRKLIRIHPALDHDWVPRYFITFIVYHELLHALFPPTIGEQATTAARSTSCSGTSKKRRTVHTPEFSHMERQFPAYEEAMRWEAANLHRFLKR